MDSENSINCERWTQGLKRVHSAFLDVKNLDMNGESSDMEAIAARISVLRKLKDAVESLNPMFKKVYHKLSICYANHEDLSVLFDSFIANNNLVSYRLEKEDGSSVPVVQDKERYFDHILQSGKVLFAGKVKRINKLDLSENFNIDLKVLSELKSLEELKLDLEDETIDLSDITIPSLETLILKNAHLAESGLEPLLKLGKLDKLILINVDKLSSLRSRFILHILKRRGVKVRAIGI